MSSGDGIRTLVVEDDAGTRRLLLEFLQNRGHDVTACADGETGWVAYARDKPSLVLLDLKLPGIDGIELCRRIRRDPGTHEPVVVFITSAEDGAAWRRPWEREPTTISRNR